jgi:hypothetical protein
MPTDRGGIKVIPRALSQEQLSEIRLAGLCRQEIRD